MQLWMQIAIFLSFYLETNDKIQRNTQIMVLKWLFDRLVSLIGLLFLWPVLVVVSIMVRVKMPGRPATLKYRLEDEMLEQFCEQVSKGIIPSEVSDGYKGQLPDFSKMTTQEVAVWYNDNVIYPDKVRLNCYYYRHYSFVKDIEMIFATLLGKKILYNGEKI